MISDAVSPFLLTMNPFFPGLPDHFVHTFDICGFFPDKQPFAAEVSDNIRAAFHSLRSLRPSVLDGSINCSSSITLRLFSADAGRRASSKRIDMAEAVILTRYRKRQISAC